MMKEIEHNMPLVSHEFQFDEVFAAGGFAGEAPEPPISDVMLLSIESTLSFEDELAALNLHYIELLRQEDHEMRENDFTDGEIASYLVGCAVGRRVFDVTRVMSSIQRKNLIDRALQNIRIAREEHGYGDEMYFEGGFNFAYRFCKQHHLSYEAPAIGRYVETATVTSKRGLHKKRSRHLFRRTYGFPQNLRTNVIP